MTETLEQALMAVDQSKFQKGEKCPWEVCKSNHATEIKYPGGGSVERNGSYANDWVKAGLEPWILYDDDGTDSLATLRDYRRETPKAAYAVPASKLKHPEYHTQKHHLISINLFKGVKKLGRNAKRIRYDANCKENGSCFPTYVADIVRHDLQCHRGSHPTNLYNSQIKPYLRDIEKRCVKYCVPDEEGKITWQKDLTDDLHDLSARVTRQIKAWKWLLRSKALQEQKVSRILLARKLARQGTGT